MHMNRSLFKVAAPTLFVFSLHLIALSLDMYNRHPHFDVIMHLLGGGAIAMSWLLMNKLYFPKSSLPFLYQLIVAVGIVTLVGVCWEFYEFLLDTRDGLPIRQLSIANTMQDLACDLLGALLISALTFWRRR